MFSRILQQPLKQKKSFFLFGPRGTGKTTWVKTMIPDALYIDLLDGGIYSDLLSQPNRLEKMIPPGFKKWVVLDEIQRVPECLNEIHRLIENKGIRFILTGSSARKLRKKGINLLAGRALTYHFHPLTSLELGENFKIDYSLKWGHLPSIFNMKDPQSYLKSYIQTYLREEILQEGLTRNLEGFSRFLESASFSQASLLNVSKIASEVGFNRMTIENYFSILEDLMIGKRIPIFSKRAKRRLVTHSKFFLFDTGIYKTIRPMGPLDAPEEAQGPGLETLVFQELCAINDYFNFGYQFFFWRTSNGTEVDLVLYGTRGLIAIEIKRSGRFSKEDLKGLLSFKKDYPIAHCFFVSNFQRIEYQDGLTLVPLETFFKQAQNILSDPSCNTNSIK